jgi:hypothetical protein
MGRGMIKVQQQDIHNMHVIHTSNPLAVLLLPLARLPTPARTAGSHLRSVTGARAAFSCSRASPACWRWK